jgi:probable HAF family extracellular repeat protein
MRTILWISGLFALLTALLPGKVTAAPYTIMDLGAVPDGNATFAYALNDAGVVVGSSGPGIGPFQAFRYADGLITGIGTLPGGAQSEARAVNSSGAIAGYSDTATGSVRAFLFTNDAFVDIGALGLGRSFAYGLNDSGRVVGVSDIGAFLYRAGTVTPLGAPVGATSFSPRSINAGGAIAGTVTLHDGQGRAAVWRDGSWTVLGTLGGRSSTGLSINDHGYVVGLSETAAGDTHGFLYTGGELIDLGTLGGSETFPAAINNQGHIVGGSRVAAGPLHAFLYTDGVMSDLAALSGEMFEYAVDINEVGQIVAWESVTWVAGTTNRNFQS